MPMTKNNDGKWVYPITMTTDTHNVIFNTENKFLDADIKAEISVNSGSVSPMITNTNLDTYFNTGTAGSNSISIVPKATTTAGFIAAYDSNHAVSGTTLYYTIITTTPSFSGGNLNNKAASAEFSSNIITTSSNNGIYFTARGTAGRAAVTYTNTAGWLAAHSTATTASNAVSASTWDGTTYYISGINVPSAKDFTITMLANTGADTSKLTITNNAYRNVEITNSGIVKVTSAANNKGDVSIAAYASSSDTATPDAQTVVDDGVWITYNKNPTSSAQGPFYGKTSITAVSKSSNLIAGNIKAGETVVIKGGNTNIWSIAGTFTSDATAEAGHILTGKSAYVNGNKVNGSMANNGTLGGTISTQNGTYTIPAGYTTGGTVTATFPTTSITQQTWTKNSSTNIVTTKTAKTGTGYISNAQVDAASFANSAANGVTYLDLTGAKKDSNTFFVPEIAAGGTLYINRGYIDNVCIDLSHLIADESGVVGLTGDYILQNHSAYDNNGNLIVGTITSLAAHTYTPTTIDQTIAAGQYLSGAQTISGDANLIAGNIKYNVAIFGVTGTFTVTPSGKNALTATALRSGYAGFINGNQVNGSMPDVTDVTPIATITNINTYFDNGTQSSNSIAITPSYTNATAGYLAQHTTAQNGTVVYKKIKVATFSGNGGNVTLVADNTSNSIYKSTSNTGNAAIVNSAPATNSGYVYIKVTGSGTAKAATAGWITEDGATATGSSTKYVRLLGYDGSYTVIS